MPTAFLSNPAASPSTPGKSSPITLRVRPVPVLLTRPPTSRVTGWAARMARKASPWTCSGSARVSTRSKS